MTKTHKHGIDQRRYQEALRGVLQQLDVALGRVPLRVCPVRAMLQVGASVPKDGCMKKTDVDAEQEMAQQLYVAILAQNGAFKDADLEKTVQFCLKAAAIFYQVVEG